ncbi:MAG TPA: hotdog domain-containing protein [Candidatus Acidoferrales bacterium]|jgi:predicted thioesterase|nr:hotdog domain-containing protein [Candidatus Acidoferrales bacterium]
MSATNPKKIELGLEGFCERVVTPELTLAHYNPDWPAVFSTPAMIGLMECASSEATRLALPPGAVQVGVRIEVDHLKAVPVGATVMAASRLVEIDGRRLIFEAEARSGSHVIGRGRIFHTIVDHSRFVASAAAKHTST